MTQLHCKQTRMIWQKTYWIKSNIGQLKAITCNKLGEVSLERKEKGVKKEGGFSPYVKIKIMWWYGHCFSCVSVLP